MPTVARLYSIDSLMNAVDYYIQKTNKRVSFEYLLLKNINDRVEDAYKLASLLKNRLAHVNLIQYNQVKGINFQTSSIKSLKRFESILVQNGIPITIRISLGNEIKGACGQLAYINK